MNKLTMALRNATLTQDKDNPKRFYLTFDEKIKYVFENGKMKEVESA